MESCGTNREGDATVKRPSATTHRGIAVEIGSGNVYADLGFLSSSDMLVKAQLVAKIAEIIRQQRLTQVQAAKLLRLTQPRISRLLRGEFRGISERRLLRCLTRLGCDVQIVVKRTPRRRTSGRLTVHFA
jgi:predicted XRE-type DNA-binding protein